MLSADYLKEGSSQKLLTPAEQTCSEMHEHYIRFKWFIKGAKFEIKIMIFMASGFYTQQ